MTKVGLDAIGTSTTLESNKSQLRLSRCGWHDSGSAFFRPVVSRPLWNGFIPHRCLASASATRPCKRAKWLMSCIVPLYMETHQGYHFLKVARKWRW